MTTDDAVIVARACKACGHAWYPRSPERPRICPKCKSARWDIGRKFPPRPAAASAAVA